MYGEKRKGVPKRAQKVFENEKEEHYEFEKPLREKEAIRRGDIPNRWIKIHKVLTKVDDKRKWNGAESKPIFLNGGEKDVG